MSQRMAAVYLRLRRTDVLYDLKLTNMKPMIRLYSDIQQREEASVLFTEASSLFGLCGYTSKANCLKRFAIFFKEMPEFFLCLYGNNPTFNNSMSARPLSTPGK